MKSPLCHRVFAGLLAAGLLLLPVLSFAQDTAQDPAEREIPALNSEPQSAEWAKAWWMPRHEQKLEEKAELEQVDLLMIGDSITHGWENGGKAMWEQHYAKRNALNLGFSGDRTEQVLWRLQNGEVDSISPKLAVLMIGTNNTGHRMDPAEETAAGVEAIVDELRTRLPEMKVLVLAVFPRGETPEDEMRQRNNEINERLSKLADEKHVFYLDLSDEFLAEDGTLPKSIMPDLLHPNAEGYRLWAAAMEPTIVRLMGEN